MASREEAKRPKPDDARPTFLQRRSHHAVFTLTVQAVCKPSCHDVMTLRASPGQSSCRQGATRTMSHLLKLAGRRAAVPDARLPGLWRFCVRQSSRGAASTATADEQAATEEAVRPFEEIPGPKGLPFFGSALDYIPFGKAQTQAAKHSRL
ncbi:hypothetical protein Bbelb_052300 [Branchiostoma belcheri]|nr:hypothetical protein Bbelb_052300 [Branchiostoma belcheri]